MTARWIRTLGVVAVVSGCAAETTDDDPGDGELALQAVLTRNPFTLAVPAGGDASADFGSAAAQTCYIAGIHGDLAGQSFTPYTPIAEAGLEIDANNHWIAHASPGIGTGVSVTVACIANVGHRVQMSAHECTDFQCPVPSVPGGPGSEFPNRRCFISDVWSRAGMTFHFQGDPEPGIWIEPSNKRFYLKTQSSNDAGEASNMGGSATCVDITGDAPGSWTDAAVSSLRVCDGSVTRAWFSGIFGDFNGSLATGMLLKNDTTGGAELNDTGGKSMLFDCIW